MNRKKIEKRVYQYATVLVHKKGYVSPIDVLLEIGWLTDEKVEQWRMGKIPYLERVATANLAKLNFALHMLRKFAQ